MLSRRKALGLVGSTGALGGVSGCLDVIRGDGISIRIENVGDQQLFVDILVEEGDETVFSDLYLIAPGAEFRTSNVLTAGKYLVTVDVDDVPYQEYTVSDVNTVEVDMEGCELNSLVVEVNSEGGAHGAHVGSLYPCRP